MWFDRRIQERGAVAIVLALIVTGVLIPLSALAVDIGMQRVARRDAQAVADVVSLDLARMVADDKAPSDAEAAIRAARTNGVVGTTPAVRAYPGYIAPGAAFVSDQSLGCGATRYNSYFTAVPAGEKANAVLVTSTGSAPFSLMPGRGAVCRSAIAATVDRNACFTVNSYAAQLKGDNNLVLTPLLKLLGSDLNLTAIASSGIADTNVDLLTFLEILRLDLGLATIEEVLQTDVSIARVLAAEVQALLRSGSTAQSVITVLNQQLIANLGKLPVVGSFKLGSLLSLSQGLDSALGVGVNALDLAMGSLFLANGQNALRLDLGTSARLTGLTGSLSIIQKPQLACGPEGTKAVSPQIRLDVGARLTEQGSLTGALVDTLSAGLSLVSCLTSVLTGHCQWLEAEVGDLSVGLSVAEAEATLDRIVCSGVEASSLILQQSASLLPIDVELPLTISYVDKNIYTGAIRRKSVTLSTSVTTRPTQPGTDPISFSVPAEYNKPKAGQSGNLSLDNLSITTSVTGDTDTLIGGVLGTLSKVLNGVQSALITPLTRDVLGPLFSLLTTTLNRFLGLDLAGSSFAAVPTATCGGPRLVG